MSRDIVPRSSHPQRLIAAVRIEGELAEQLSILANDPNVQAGREHHDASAGVPTTNLDVVQPAVVARRSQDDPEAAARRALELLAERSDGYAIHLDVDVVDFTDAPLSEHPSPTRHRRANDIRSFCSAAHDSGAGGTDGSEESAAWLAWATQYAAALDPLSDALATPKNREPSPDELRPYLHGWTPYSPA